MLQTTYRFAVKNATGSALGAGDTLTITAKRWKFNSSGALTPEASEATVFNASVASLANNAWVTGATIDNSTDGYLGGEFVITPSITPAGNVEVWMHYSTDGGTTWNSNGYGQFVATVSSTNKAGFEI